VLLLPQDPDAAVLFEAWPPVRAAWEAAGLIVGGRGGPGLVEGGCARVWLDRPGGLTLYKNEYGGFRVDCPACGGLLSGPFGLAMEAWRRGGPRSLVCPGCGGEAGLEALCFRPEAAFAMGALVFSDVGGIELSAEALEGGRALFGPCRSLLRRLA
jgi:hypothetical protein